MMLLRAIRASVLIMMTSTHARKQGVPELSLVGFTCPDSQRQYRFLTNNFKLVVSTIAAIYIERWQVELFFKVIKKLKFKAFLGGSQNTVMTQIWIATISYWLMHDIAQRRGGRYKRILQLLQLSLFERKALTERLNPAPSR